MAGRGQYDLVLEKLSDTAWDAPVRSVGSREVCVRQRLCCC